MHINPSVEFNDCLGIQFTVTLEAGALTLTLTLTLTLEAGALRDVRGNNMTGITHHTGAATLGDDSRNATTCAHRLNKATTTCPLPAAPRTGMYNYFVPDKTPPVYTGFSPKQIGSNVAEDTNVTITWSEGITMGTG